MRNEFVITVSVPVCCDNKMDGRKIRSAQLPPRDHIIVYPVLVEYSPVTKAHNGAAGSLGEDKTFCNLSNYRSPSRQERNKARQSQLTSRQITAAIKLNSQTLRGAGSQTEYKVARWQRCLSTKHAQTGKECGKHPNVFARDQVICLQTCTVGNAQKLSHTDTQADRDPVNVNVIGSCRNSPGASEDWCIFNAHVSFSSSSSLLKLTKIVVISVGCLHFELMHRLDRFSVNSLRSSQRAVCVRRCCSEGVKL